MSGRWLRRTLIACLVGGIGIAVAAQTTWERDHGAGVKAAKAAHFGEAEKLLSDSVEEARRQAAVSPLLARSLVELAEVYRTEGKYSQAQGANEEALQVCTKHGVRNRCR